MSDEEFKATLEAVMGNLADSFTKMMRDKPEYGRLFEAYEHGGIEGMLRRCENEMSMIALTAADIISVELKRDLNREEWDILQGLPLVTDKMEKAIIKSEGHSCCVDKVYQRLSTGGN